MKVALIVDNSDAAEGSLNSLRDGLLGFLDTLPTQHEVGLFTIAGQTRLRVDFTTDRDELRGQAEALFVERHTATLLLDGLVEIWKRRFSDDDPWPVFVVVAYDGPEASRAVQEEEFNEFTHKLYDRAATMHVILVSRGSSASVLSGRKVTDEGLGLPDREHRWELSGVGRRHGPTGRPDRVGNGDANGSTRK